MVSLKLSELISEKDLKAKVKEIEKLLFRAIQLSKGEDQVEKK